MTMRQNLIEWAKWKDDERRVCPDFLMACKFEGFDIELIEKELAPLASTSETRGVRRILKSYRRKRDDSRLVIWDDHNAQLVPPQEPYWMYMDPGRMVIEFGYGNNYFILEDEDAKVEVALRAKEKLENYTVRNNLQAQCQQVVRGRVWLLDIQRMEELAKKSEKVLQATAEATKANVAGEAADEKEVRHAEGEDNKAWDAGVAKRNYDYGKALAKSREDIANNYGRGRREVGGSRIRYKSGRMYNTKTGEYLIAPGLNFGPASWLHDHRGYDYWRDRGRGYIERPADVVKKLAALWKDNVDGTYKKDDVVVNYETWLATKPVLRMGIRNNNNVLIEKTLALERRTHDPKTGKEYTHIHYCMNGYRVPRARWHVALNHWTNVNIPDWEFNGFLQQMGKYTVEMLALPNAIKTVSFSVPSLTNRYGDTEKFDIKFLHRLNEGYWNVYCADLMSGKKRASHDKVRQFLGKLRGGYNSMSSIVEAFGDVEVTEQDFMQALQVRAYRKLMREKKSEDLLKDVAAQFPDKITYFEDEKYVIVRGKLRNYKVNLEGNDSHGKVKVNVANWDGGSQKWIEGAWVCAFEDSRTDTGIVWDKVVTRTLMLMNDEEELARRNMNLH